jgi:hypothetical protein|tara:strand:+ start:672 stop:1007 length:336 start_codon:yes stop_codon:yes gene_type:complete
MDNTVLDQPQSGSLPKQKERKAPIKHQDKLVVNAVISLLGKPKDLDHVRAHNVFSDRWRVDVWCSHQSDPESFSSELLIDYSYFIRFDNESNEIISSDPEIKPLDRNKGTK